MKENTQMFSKKTKIWSLSKLLVWFSAIFTVGVLIWILGFIMVRGVPYLSMDFLFGTYSKDTPSMLPALFNTLVIIGISLAIAVPIGVATAIYLVEYTKKTNHFVKVIRTATETLAGIPSIVYGLFGFLFFVTFFNFGWSLLAGALTVGIMVLPIIIRTSEEALKSVPNMYREGSFGLGASKLRTIYKIVLPAALPGIMAAILLSIGRIIGESAALIFTAGTVAGMPESIFSSGRTLAVDMYVLSNEGLHVNEAYATAVVLVVLVVILNIIATMIGKKLRKDK